MTDIGETVAIGLDPEVEEEEEEKSVNIRFSVFFDGTLNNRTNIEQRLLAADENDLTGEELNTLAELKKKYGEEEIQQARDLYEDLKGVGSYENGFTNIVKMEKYVIAEPADEYDLVMASYVEGAGTEDKKKDSMMGYAFGIMATGIKKKVMQGVKDVVDKISGKHTDKEAVIKTLTLDALGFSRGAASARYFIHVALLSEDAIREQLIEQGYKVKQVKIHFAGLFDTVSAHGLPYYSDTSSLKLQSVRHAKKTVQLAAADEHRAAFCLTDISSAPNGTEIYLPGVHSDIGGGYRDGDKEEQALISSLVLSTVEQDRDFLLAAGWYQKDELEIRTRRLAGPGKRPMRRYTLYGHRASISSQYSRIPLHLMVDFAADEKININPELKRNEAIPGRLSSIESRIRSYVDQHKSSGSSSESNHWHHNDAWLRELRHDYFHFSSRLEIGHGPRFINGKRGRLYFHG